MKAVPFLTIVTALLAVAVYAWPGALEFCVLDRGAFLRGEWWRAFTAHLVHFSPSHLWLNAAVFIVAGGIIERQNRHAFAALFISASIAISGAVLMFAPEFQFYGGLSGIATAMLFLIAIQCVAGEGLMRVCGILAISAILAKLVFEGLHPQPLFARFDSALIRSAPISHAAGIVAAVAIWCVTRMPWRRAGTNSFSPWVLRF
jgi:rhomboid family GlyGly-CTERM serine protease